MKTDRSLWLLLLIPLLLLTNRACAWGEWGHEHINKAAIFALPAELCTFFYNHADYLIEESVVPDLRKYTMGDKTEFARHYINLEDYDSSTVSNGNLSLEDLKRTYTDSELNRKGILPWYIGTMMDKLTNAFRNKRKAEILYLAADIGHYIADAHMPLHTSVNHDGQLTEQRGIHAFWESQIPELFGAAYNLHTMPAHYISDLRKETWSIINHSHQLVDALLLAEKATYATFPEDKVYAHNSAGNIIKNKFGQPVHSKEYAHQYNIALHGMVEKQMKRAVYELACFWYTAWVNAGKPDLSGLDTPEMIRNSRLPLKAEYSLWLKGKVKGLRPGREF